MRCCICPIATWIYCARPSITGAEPGLAAVLRRPARRTRKLHRRNNTAHRSRTGVERISQAARRADPPRKPGRHVDRAGSGGWVAAARPAARPVPDIEIPRCRRSRPAAELFVVRRGRAISDQCQTRRTRRREQLAASKPRPGSVIEVAAPRGDFYLAGFRWCSTPRASVPPRYSRCCMRSLLAAATAKSGGFTSLAIRRPSPSAGKWAY